MKSRILLVIFLLTSAISFGQKTADIGFSLDPGVSYIVDYFKEDWQPFRPSGSLGIFIEKNGSFFSYGTSIQFFHLRTKVFWGDITLGTTTPLGMPLTIVYPNQTILINSNNFGINFYTKLSVKKIQLNLGVMPFKELYRKSTYVNEDMPSGNSFGVSKRIYNLTDGYGLGLKFELSYAIAEKVKVRFSGLQTYKFRSDPIQFTLGVSYRLMELGKTHVL